MLRQPSTCHHPTPRGEGCSSTAIAEKSYVDFEIENNFAGRGSSKSMYDFSAAVP